MAAIEHDEGHALRLELQHIVAVGRGRGENQPVELLVEQMAQIGRFLVLVVVGIAEHQVVLLAPEHVLDPAHHGRKERVRHVGQQQAHRPGLLQP
jgi:hypothetical protein